MNIDIAIGITLIVTAVSAVTITWIFVSKKASVLKKRKCPIGTEK